MPSSKAVLMFVDGDTTIRDIKKHISKRPRPGRKSRHAAPPPKIQNVPTPDSDDCGDFETRVHEVVMDNFDQSRLRSPEQSPMIATQQAVPDSVENWLTTWYGPSKYPGNALDPFHTTLLSKYAFVPTILDVQVACPSPISFRVKRNTVIPQSLGGVEVIRTCLHDEVLLFCFALPASSIAKYFLGSHGIQPLTQSRNWLQVEAVKGLRSRLEEMGDNGNVDIAVLLAIWRLFMAELAEGRYDNAKLHMRAFRKLSSNIQEPSGPLGLFFRERFDWGDLNVGLETLSPPEFVPTSEPFPKERFEQLEPHFRPSDRVVGVAFSALATRFSPDLYEIICELREWAQIHHFISSCTAPEESDIKWLSWRGNTLCSNLLAFDHKSDNSHGTMNQTIQETVRVAIIVWMSFFVSHPLMSRYPSLLLPHLLRKCSWIPELSSTTSSTPFVPDTSIQHLILWILFVGTCAEDEAGDTERKFAVALRKRMKLSQIRGLIHFETLMNQFFYSEQFQNGALNHIWVLNIQEDVESGYEEG